MAFDLYSISARILAALALAVFFAFNASGQEPAFSLDTSPLPAPTGHVNDYAGMIDEASKTRLESRLRAFKDSTGVEIAVVVVNTTGNREIFDYSLAVARGWGIGSQADDNPSALLFVAVEDRKYFTQISRDLEDELPDGVAGSLQRQFLVPEFRKGNYSKGIEDTIEAYIAAIEYKLSGAGSPPPTDADGATTGVSGRLESICCWVIVLIVLISIISASRGGRKGKDDQDRWGGGGFGGGGGALPWIIGAAIANSGSSSGSSWGGGGGGGSSWGGFGGGGDFGGGGAGGGW
ncbi:MAG TPA: TPM domain-containing protein [Pyrinomonadaceae bacterium]|nr:TPM domain-containing protein [Pyrinomonadaceae bacterium]